MKTELLNPDIITEKLKIRLLELKEALVQKEKSQKNLPEGHLRIDQCHGSKKIQFFHRTDPKNFKGTYIPKSQIALARRLAQKDYDQKVIKELRSQIKLMENYIGAIENKMTALYTKLSDTRKTLVEPVTLTDEQYSERWLAQTWQGRPFAEDAPEYYTARGERVRSKSEIIIADTLNRHKISDRYEFPLPLREGQIFHPDFLCLNVRTRQEFFWEHFGMLDNPDYAENVVHKLKLFNENGIFPGKNLIITAESQLHPISKRQIENIIHEYLP